MYHLRLCKARSYRGVVCATKKHPDVYVGDKEEADALVATGFFTLVGVTGEGDEPIEDGELHEESSADGATDETEDVFEEGSEDVEENSILTELQSMKKDDLIAYAEEHGIDITGRRTKDDIYSKIVEDLARAAEARQAIRDSE